MKIFGYTNADGVHLVKVMDNGVKGDYLIEPSPQYTKETLLPLQEECSKIQAIKSKEAKIQEKLRKFAEGLTD